MCQKELVGRSTSLADLQHLNPQLFKQQREPTVNIAQAILCTFFPPPPAPEIAPHLPPSSSTAVQPAVETDRSSPPITSHSVFSLSGVKASLGFTTSNSASVPPSPLVPKAVVIPPALPLPPFSQLYTATSSEPYTLDHPPDAHTRAPLLPSWAQAVLEAGGGALGGTCKISKVGYSLVFGNDGSKHAVAAAAAAAAACGVGEGADSSLTM